MKGVSVVTPVMSTVVIAYHSGYGHTKKVAEHILKGVSAVEGVTGHLLDVTAVAEPIGDFATGWDALAAADGIIFGTPTYMGGPSAQFKTFADASAQVWFGQGWKDKIAAGFTNSLGNAGDKNSTLYYLSTLAAQHGMVWVTLGMMNDGHTNRNGFSVGLGTQSDNAPAEETPGEADLQTSEKFGSRVAEAVLRWNR